MNRKYRVSLWTLATFAFAVVSTASAVTIDNIALEINPTGKTPLSGKVTFSTDAPASIRLLADDGQDTLLLTATTQPATSHDMMVLGLYSDRTYTIRIEATDASGDSATADAGEFTTPPLPDYMVPIDLKVSRPRRMEPGVTIVPLLRWPRSGPEDTFGLAIAVDAHGEIVWYLRSDKAMGELFPTPQGTFLYQIGRGTGILVEVDLLGNELRQWHKA